MMIVKGLSRGLSRGLKMTGIRVDRVDRLIILIRID